MTWILHDTEPYSSSPPLSQLGLAGMLGTVGMLQPHHWMGAQGSPASPLP